MTTPAHKPLRVFCSYAHEDEERLNVLREWLRGLERQGLIEWWHDREIVPGWEWEETIDKNLRTAEVILLLVTPDFMASDYVYEKEIARAIERHERGEARVIPIIVRPSDWKWTPFGRLQALPKDAKPITTWPNRDEAWLDVAEGLRRAVEELSLERQERAAAEERMQRITALYDRGQRHIDAEEWQQALECLEEVQRVEPGYRATEELLSQVRQELALPSTVTVPNLGGQKVPQARGTLANSNLKLGGQHVAPSDTISEGQIIEQNPEAGTEVEADSSVSVTISLGSRAATAADSLSQGVTESEHAEPPPSSHQPGQLDSGPERVGPRTWQKDRMVGQSTDRTERVQPDYSTDIELQPPLPMLARNWWALALGGLIIVTLGLVVYLAWQSSGSESVAFRVLASTLLMANGVFTILASSTAHTKLLLRTQGMASILAGLVAFLSSWAGGNLFFIVHYVSFGSWGLSLGIIQIVAAMRFGWDVKVMRLMVLSGASLVIYSMYGFYKLSQWAVPIPWLLAIWLLASGISLVVFAFRVRQLEEAEVEG